MENKILKTLVYNNQVRFYYVNNTRLIQNIFEMNKDMPIPLKVMLGKAVSVMSLLSNTLKGNSRMSLQISMSDPKLKLFAEAKANGDVRGYLNEELQKMTTFTDCSVSDIIGPHGTLRVVKGSDMTQFTSITDMPFQNITDDIAHHFLQSDQVLTSLHAEMDIGKDGSLLSSSAVYAQLLPGAPAHLLEGIEEKIEQNPKLFSRGGSNAAPDITLELKRVFEDIKFIGSGSTRFYCGCSKEMFSGMLYSLSVEELSRMIELKETADAFCHVCGCTYHFDQHDLAQLI